MCLTLLLIAPLLLALTADGQDSARPSVLQSDRRLVNVNVTVQGLSGKPITGLAKSNFQLFDNGEPETISVFAEESNTHGASAPADESTGLANLGPDVFSNRIDTGTHPPSSVTVILLDILNSGVRDQGYARAQVVHFLRQIKPGDRVGLYSLGASLRVLHDFTADASDLLDGLNEYGSRASADPLGLASIFSMEGNAFERDYFLKNRVEATIRAIGFIAEHTISAPGRKNLIWVSGDFPLTAGYGAADDLFNADSSAELKRCLAAVSAAGLAIYPADAHVLLNAKRADLEKTHIEAVDPRHNMQLIAARTGGRSFNSRNDLDHAIEQAIADSEGSYTLGFYPSHENFDGAYHKLKVVLNAPHSDVRYRDGYFDFAKPRQDRKTREADMKVAATSPIDANGISLTAQVLPARKANKAAGPNALQVTLQINPNTISLTPKGVVMAGQLDALFVQHDAVGRSLGFETKFIDLKLSSSELAKIHRFGILFREDLLRAKGAESLRVVVRDVNSGVMGSLTIPYRQLSSQ
jgi:VWFA-related protein